MATNKVKLNGFEAQIKFRTKSQSGLGNYSIATRNFIHLIRDTQYAQVGKPCVGISIPTAELKIVLDKPQSAIILLQADAVKVDIIESQLFKDNNGTATVTETYDVTNFDIAMRGGGVELTLYMISYAGYMTTQSTIKAYGTADSPVTSIKAIYEATTQAQLTVEHDQNADGDAQVTESFKTDDLQVWIQPQQTTLQFVANTIKHCNPVNDDLILSAITTDQKLRLISYNGSMNKTKDKADAYIYLALPKEDPNKNKNAVSLVASAINLESSIGVYSYLTGIDSIPQVKMLSNRQNIFSKIGDLIFKPKAQDPNDDNSDLLATKRIVAPLIDCGNTHEHYWDAQFANEKKLAKIYRNIIYVTVDGVSIDNSLRVLDTAYVNLKGQDQAQGTAQAFLEGNFIVLGISRFVSQSQTSNRIALGKASYS